MFKSFSKKNKLRKPALIYAISLFLIIFSPFVSKAEGGLISGLFSLAVEPLAQTLLQVSTWISGLGGLLLNYVLHYTVIELGSHLGELNGGIQVAWSTLRDLINISFIFILLYAAISTILGNATGQIKKVITSVVIAAIFINFSMFITRTLIDASNIITVTFYKQMSPGATNDFWTGGLSNQIQNAIQTQRLQAIENSVNLGGNGASINLLIVDVMGSVIMLITAFIFGAIAIMFLIRYVNLILLLIFSPVAFAPSGIPQISSFSKKWTERLTKELIFAPLYMIVTWAIVKIISDPNFQITASQTGLVAASGAPTIGAIALIFNFIIVITLLVATLALSRQVADQGKSIGAGIVNSITGKGTSMLGSLGRKTIGKGAYALQQSGVLQKGVEKGGIVGRMAMGGLLATDYASKSSFDLRNAPGADIARDMGLGELGLGGKAGGKGGYVKAREDETKKFDARKKLLEESQAKKDDIKARLGEIADEKKPIEDTIKKLEEKQKAAEASSEYKDAKAQSEAVESELKKIDRDIRDRNDQLNSGGLTPSGEMRVRAELDQLNTQKTSAESRGAQAKATMSSALGENTAEKLKEAQKQKAEIEKRENEIKTEDNNIKRSEKERKRAYAKSLVETPEAVTVEFEKLTKALEEISGNIKEAEGEIRSAQLGGDTAGVEKYTKELEALKASRDKTEKERAKYDRKTFAGALRSLTSVVNMGLEGVVVAVATGGVVQSATGARKDASVSIRASLAGKSKEAALIDDIKALTEKKLEPTTEEKPTTADTKPEPPKTT